MERRKSVCLSLATLPSYSLPATTMTTGMGGRCSKATTTACITKLAAKYFNHRGKEIPLDTVRNYFVGKGEAPIKGSHVPEDRKLFRIVPADQA